MHPYAGTQREHFFYMQPVYKQKSFLCNKRKIDVEPAIHQTSTVSKASL